MGPREQARRARNILLEKKQKTLRELPPSPKYLTRNIALEEARTVQQTSGVPVSKEEQRIANNNVLEYTFQIELRLKPSDTILGKFQEFVIKAALADPNIIFVPWFYKGSGVNPEISITSTLFETITGSARLKYCLGGYNCTKRKFYGRVKVHARLTFQNVKDKMVDWLRQDLHWMKEDYIQAKRVSNIGLLAYTHSVTDPSGTRGGSVC